MCVNLVVIIAFSKLIFWGGSIINLSYLCTLICDGGGGGGGRDGCVFYLVKG